MDKSDSAYKTIGEVAKILNFKSNNKGNLPTHVIRFWETQFKQIKPKIMNANRRYYDENTINLLKKIKYLLKEKGLTILGAKKILDSAESQSIDPDKNIGINSSNFETPNTIKKRIKNISKLIKEIKKIK